ncbi:MAG: glycosyltransferase family 9 protein [Fimbriimonas sp.]
MLVRFSAIGDCVMAAWAATSIRQLYPEVFLCWAVESRCAAVIDRQTLCSRVYEFPRDRWKRKRWSPKTWREQLVTHARLRNMRFDYGIDLQGHSKTALCLRIAKPKQRVAARATDSMAARLNPMVGEAPHGTHTVEWNHQVLRTFGDFVLPQAPIMPPRAEPAEGLITISVSAGQADKAYPADHWREVAEALLQQGRRVAFLGGPTDTPIKLDGAEDYVGQLGLEKTMQMVAQSDLHLAADTGTGHMAAAYRVPVVSVFGPTDPAIYRPYTDNGKVLRAGQKTADVKPEHVIKAARELLP